jgi:hypothetical protein
MQPVGDDAWMPAVIRHWMLDGASAR